VLDSDQQVSALGYREKTADAQLIHDHCCFGAVLPMNGFAFPGCVPNKNQTQPLQPGISSPARGSSCRTTALISEPRSGSRLRPRFSATRRSKSDSAETDGARKGFPPPSALRGLDARHRLPDEWAFIGASGGVKPVRYPRLKRRGVFPSQNVTLM
jgi:hypothetical protein